MIAYRAQFLHRGCKSLSTHPHQRSCAICFVYEIKLTNNLVFCRRFWRSAGSCFHGSALETPWCLVVSGFQPGAGIGWRIGPVWCWVESFPRLQPQRDCSEHRQMGLDSAPKLPVVLLVRLLHGFMCFRARPLQSFVTMSVEPKVNRFGELLAFALHRACFV